jgi:hypothetical protein
MSDNANRILGFVIAIVVVGLLMFGLSRLGGIRPKPAKPQQAVEKPKTFWDVVREDDKRLRAEVNQPVTLQSQPKEGQQKPPQQQEKPKYEELTAEQQVDAEKLFEMAITQRKMARLPGMTYKKMVDYCREIIEKYPNSSYADKARRMLAEVPQTQRRLYEITDKELGISP